MVVGTRVLLTEILKTKQVQSDEQLKAKQSQIGTASCSVRNAKTITALFKKVDNNVICGKEKKR